MQNKNLTWGEYVYFLGLHISCHTCCLYYNPGQGLPIAAEGNQNRDDICQSFSENPVKNKQDVTYM